MRMYVATSSMKSRVDQERDSVHGDLTYFSYFNPLHASGACATIQTLVWGTPDDGLLYDDRLKLCKRQSLEGVHRSRNKRRPAFLPIP